MGCNAIFSIALNRMPLRTVVSSTNWVNCRYPYRLKHCCRNTDEFIVFARRQCFAWNWRSARRWIGLDCLTEWNAPNWRMVNCSFARWKYICGIKSTATWKIARLCDSNSGMKFSSGASFAIGRILKIQKFLPQLGHELFVFVRVWKYTTPSFRWQDCHLFCYL